MNERVEAAGKNHFILHRRGNKGPKLAIIVSLAIGVIAPSIPAQQKCIRIMKQDSTLNNLVDPPGYRTSPIGTLGGIEQVGTGQQAMILIPGLGFSGAVFEEFMQRYSGEYHMYAITLAGFGGTAAPPCPNQETSFGKQTWTSSAMAGIEQLMIDEHIQNPILVGHWLTGTQLALRFALKHPDNTKAVVLLAGALRLYVSDTAYAKYYGTPEKRVASVDRYLAPIWFKTVTRETWDDNNFLPGDYAVNPVRGLRLWREAATPPLHVWVRYLCEFNAQDLSDELPKLRVPTLLLQPGLEGLEFDPGNNYMENYCRTGWQGAVEAVASITVKSIPHSRACLWLDQPEEVYSTVSDFLKRAK